jgi:hypothetical protein
MYLLLISSKVVLKFLHLIHSHRKLMRRGGRRRRTRTNISTNSNFPNPLIQMLRLRMLFRIEQLSFPSLLRSWYTSNITVLFPSYIIIFLRLLLLLLLLLLLMLLLSLLMLLLLLLLLLLELLLAMVIKGTNIEGHNNAVKVMINH